MWIRSVQPLGPAAAKGALDALPSAGASSRRLAVIAGSSCRASAPRAAELDTVTLDWAYYNPVSLVLKQQGWLEEELKPDGIQVHWVQSLGSNKALEFLNAGSLDFGSTAGAAALLGKINGNPIETIWVYSKPEWTALVTRPDTGIAKVEDLKGKRIAVTKGTDPYIFLLRALEPARPDRERRRASCCCSTTRAGWRWSAATSTPGPGSTR